MELNKIPLLDIYNHGHTGRPHQQYENNKYETSQNNALNTYIKVFNYKIQGEPSLVSNVKKRFSKGVIFEAHIYTPKTGKGSNTLGTIAVMLIPNENEIFAKTSYTPLINSENNYSVIEPILTYKKTGNTETVEFDVNLYIKVKNSGSPITIIPIFFADSFYIQNKYNKLYDSETSDYERLIRLLKDFPNNSYFSENDFNSETTGYTIVHDQNYIKTVPSYVYSGNSTDLSLSIQNNIEIIKMNPNGATNLSKIIMNDVYEGKKIKVIIWNTNTTLIHAGGNMHTAGNDNKLLLIGNTNRKMNTGDIVKFIYMNNKWLEF